MNNFVMMINEILSYWKVFAKRKFQKKLQIFITFW